ncbi:hypothetical protein Pcinc_034555 [Petrolisthes cinctipes]|uniref:Uncharacterized protein n=1 Tax=Petrolisthes cinctipes TaxID=88211 RepID=A0AAE1ENT2_PETCI|nr:hypothetical protein Pcinc_034555 [Petrolisthes cinctipes]
MAANSSQGKKELVLVEGDPIFCSKPSHHPSLQGHSKVMKALVDASTTISVIQYQTNCDIYTLTVDMFSHPPSPSLPPPGRPFIWTPQPTSLPRIVTQWFIVAG